MYHIPKDSSPLNNIVREYFAFFRTEILALSTTQWSQEDIKGKSYKQWTIMQYYGLMYFLIIVYEDIQRTKHLGFPYSYYATKYDMETCKSTLACYNIKFDKAVEIFGLKELVYEGIEKQGIEINNLVYGES